MPPTYLLIDETAEITRTPKATLYRWRHEGTGPPAIKVGRKLLYPRSGLMAWLDEQATG